jgi:glycosyltransferase involved in cell wall biosynthesis
MNLLIVWFLIIDEWLHAPALVRDINELAEQGHNVTCIFPVIRPLEGTVSSRFKMETVSLRQLIPVVSLFWFCVMASIRSFKRFYDTDVLILDAQVYPFFLPMLVLRGLERKSSPRFVVREASPPVEMRASSKLLNLMWRAASLSLSRSSDAVFAISPVHARELSGTVKMAAQKVHVWATSVDPELFDPRKHGSDRERVRKELNVQGKFVIMHHGYISNERGLSELVEATRLVHKKQDQIRLLLLGKGPALEELKDVVRSLLLDDVVLFCGPVTYEEVPQYIAAADIGAVVLPDLPQWRDQTPTKLLEYLAMEKPVIVTDIAAHRWVVRNSVAAFFCGRGSAEEIAEAIFRSMKAPLTDEKSGRETVISTFSPHVIVQKVLRVLEEGSSTRVHS